MNARYAVPALLALVAAVPLRASGQSPPPAAEVAGIMTGGQMLVAGAALSSGAWGTDYITVSHALGIRRRYTVVLGSRPPADGAPVMACSSVAHGIDVFVLRVASHTNQPVITWGDPSELKPGDELTVLVRTEFHPEPVRMRFLHINLLQWSRTRPEQWLRQWHNVMVADGLSKPGFSGSPWVRDRKVFGLHKGQVRPEQTWYAAAETATRVRQCLNDQHYDELVPKE